MRITEDELAALYRGPAARPHPQREPRRRRGGVPLQLRARQRRHLGARRRLPLRLGPLGGRQRPPAAVRRDLARLAGVRADPRAEDRRLPGLRPLPRQVLLLARSRRRLQRLGQLHRDRPLRLRRRRRRARRGRGARRPPRPTSGFRWRSPPRAEPLSCRRTVVRFIVGDRHAAARPRRRDQTDAGGRREALRLPAPGRRAPSTPSCSGSRASRCTFTASTCRRGPSASATSGPTGSTTSTTGSTPTGGRSGFYFNIADRTRIAEAELEWRDLVVDVLATPAGRLELLDEDELPAVVEPRWRRTSPPERRRSSARRRP